MTPLLIILGVVLAGLAAYVFLHWLKLRRAEFIRTYRLPRGLLRKLMKQHPELTLKDAALVSRGLRQFFIAYLMSGKKFVSMPSVVADSLWHEFILYTREYQHFCRRAFGSFLHHTPAAVLSIDKRSNEGLRRTWWFCCRYENIDPRQPTRLPLLFALDSKLNIPGGYKYHPQCEALRERGDGGAYCGGDFASESFDGGTVGFGDGASWGDGTADAVGADGGDGGSGCGGGCGGGD